MIRIKFSKMHGLGNDFVVINNLELQHDFSAEEIQFLADRKFGIGCDQVLLVDAAEDDVSDFYYRIYNSDGNPAGQCGNGARCFIRFVLEQGLSSKSQIQLQTRERIISGQMLANGQVRVDMGVPEFRPKLIPLTLYPASLYIYSGTQGSISFSALSMGNPHAVIQLPKLEQLWERAELARIAQELQGAAIFPEGVNVNFIYRLSENSLRLLTYERGCGFTLACGSGACASAAAAICRKQVGSPVQVLMDGGELQLEWQNESLIMQGSATTVFNGEISL